MSYMSWNYYWPPELGFQKLQNCRKLKSLENVKVMLETLSVILLPNKRAIEGCKRILKQAAGKKLWLPESES